MRMLWTKSKNPADFLIGLMTGEDCAHFALVFDSPGGGVVFESNLLGTHPAFLNTWIKGRTIVHEIRVELSVAEEDALWDRWVDSFDGEPYDFGGAIYTGLMKLRKRIFGTPMPTSNPWSTKKSYYCDEIYQLVSGVPGLPKIDPDENGLSSPHDIWERLDALRSH